MVLLTWSGRGEGQIAIDIQDIVIVGAGGHAKVVADAIVSHPDNGIRFTLAGFVDDDESRTGTSLEGRPILGTLEALDDLMEQRNRLGLIVGVGDNEGRRSLFEKLLTQGFDFVTVVHRRAMLAETVRLGRGVFVAAGVVVNTGTSVGDDTILNTGCTVDHDNEIGAHVHVAPGANICGTVSVGDGTIVGVGACVIPNTKIGRNVTVAAGAAVTKDLADGGRVGGVPARDLTTSD